MGNIKNKKIFYSSIISFFAGIFISGVSENFNIILIIFLTILIISLWFFLRLKKINIFKLNLIIFSSIFFSAGFIHFSLFYEEKKGSWDNLINTKIEKVFIVDDEPEVKNWHTKLILKSKFSDDKFITWANNLPKYDYGDEIRVSGWLLPIKNFTVDGNSGNFDYINFLKKDNIFYEIKQPKIVFLQKYQGNYIKEKLFIFKKKIIQQIKKILPEPESSLLAGILIGAKEDMGKELLEEFRKTGIIHIVVLSGFNLTILAQFIMIILSVFGRKVSAIFGSLSIILFAIMTGASATIVRASLMALLVILARVLGRSSEAVRLLFLAGFIMLIFNPMLLLYDASFQLSFLATLGLLVLSPKIEDFIKYGNFKIFNLKEILGATLSTQIFVFPLLLYLMGEISIISPLVNILILILVPFSMLLGIVTIAISFINFELGLIFSYANYLILSYDLTVVHYFSDLDFSTFQWKNFSATFLFLTYFIYFIIFIIWTKRKK